MKFDFNLVKDEWLRDTRGVGFIENLKAITQGGLLNDIPHPNQQANPKQRILVVKLNQYVYAVPYIRKESDTLFLKTVFPSRKLTKQYLEKE